MKLELSVQSKRKSYKYLRCKCNPSFCKNMLDSVALFYVIMSSNVIEDWVGNLGYEMLID